MEEAKIASIGGCPGCRRSALLVDGACGECSRKFGPRFANLARKIREEPGFRELCYGGLRTELARTEFVAMFGPVDGIPVPGSADVCQGSRRGI